MAEIKQATTLFKVLSDLHLQMLYVSGQSPEVRSNKAFRKAKTLLDEAMEIVVVAASPANRKAKAVNTGADEVAGESATVVAEEEL